MTYEEIENNFSYHRPNPDSEPDFKRVRQNCRSLAHYLNQNVPDCREKSLAITKLEEAMMWANAAIARQGEKED